jgi:UDP-N-acetylmuramoyl-tripeptide--D-alanyl-D-alanine ligase
MEFFKTLDAVAVEELSVANFSKRTLLSADYIDPKYATSLGGDNANYYGKDTDYSFSVNSNEITIKLAGGTIEPASYGLIGTAGAATLLAAAATAEMIGLSIEQIGKGLKKVTAVAGRMSKLRGINGSVIIDDTYNSSPEAVRVALDYLYEQTATKKIALLGMMNEMGHLSEELHRQVGKWCDPKQLDLVVTLGKDANLYIADEARKKGCKVVESSDATEAGGIILNELRKGTIVLAKGSQNGVYAEEAVKLWLADLADSSKLVRQHSYWLSKKSK